MQNTENIYSDFTQTMSKKWANSRNNSYGQGKLDVGGLRKAILFFEPKVLAENLAYK